MKQKLNWCFFSSFLVITNFIHGYFLLYRAENDFRPFQVFLFSYRAYSKTQKPRKILISSFLIITIIIIIITTFLFSDKRSKYLKTFTMYKYIYNRLYWVDKNIQNEIKDKIKNQTVVRRIKSETTYSKTISYQVQYKTDHWNNFLFCLIRIWRIYSLIFMSKFSSYSVCSETI